MVALGVVGTSTWALIEGIKSTDGKVKDFWNLIDDLQNDVSPVLGLSAISSDVETKDLAEQAKRGVCDFKLRVKLQASFTAARVCCRLREAIKLSRHEIWFLVS